jgi:hypothetical protein
MMEATTTKMKCVACGHENQASDNACAACGSTLNLRVCPACEAINNQSAQKCHACGAALAEGPATVVEETVRAAPGDMPGRIGRMPMLFEQTPSRPAYRMAKTAIVVLPLLALGYGAGYFYRGKSAAPASTAPQRQAEAASPKVVQRDSTTPTAQAEATAPKAVVGGTAEGKITGVTHLRRGDAPAAPATPPVPVRVEPKPAKPAAPVAPERTATVPAPAPAQPHFVTHTKTPRPIVPATPIQPAAAPAASTAAAVAAPASACAESVAALGLCKADSKGEGK